MSDAKHTPGPWERRVDLTGSVVRIEGREHPDEQRSIVGYVTKFSMAEILGSKHGDDGGKAHANACLIAAAPDLLAALKETLDILHSSYLPHPSGFTDPVFGREVLTARQAAYAAIAKAEDRTLSHPNHTEPK